MAIFRSNKPAKDDCMYRIIIENGKYLAQRITKHFFFFTIYETVWDFTHRVNRTTWHDYRIQKDYNHINDAKEAIRLCKTIDSRYKKIEKQKQNQKVVWQE
jgi:hypothetical protein